MIERAAPADHQHGSKQGITTPPGNPATTSPSRVKALTEALQHELRNKPGCRINAL